jgi:hypothetical protein
VGDDALVLRVPLGSIREEHGNEVGMPELSRKVEGGLFVLWDGRLLWERAKHKRACQSLRLAGAGAHWICESNLACG